MTHKKSQKKGVLMPAHYQHTRFLKNSFFKNLGDTNDTQVDTQCQPVNNCIRTDTPPDERRKKNSSRFLSVCLTNKRCSLFNRIMLAEMICMACSLKPYLLTFKSMTL